METLAYVGLGSNLDDPQRQIRDALDALTDIPGTRCLRHSRLYRTAPWGITEQPAFVNSVAQLATRLRARELLDALLAIERANGREREGARWGPRRIDLDLLVYGEAHTWAPGLVLPHPRMAERAFVLVPLAELDAGLVIPGTGSVRDALLRVDTSGCVPID